MDDIDRAQFRDQQYQDDCERERRYQAAKNALQYTGQCHSAATSPVAAAASATPIAEMPGSMNVN